MPGAEADQVGQPVLLTAENPYVARAKGGDAGEVGVVAALLQSQRNSPSDAVPVQHQPPYKLTTQMSVAEDALAAEMAPVSVDGRLTSLHPRPFQWTRGNPAAGQRATRAS